MSNPFDTNNPFMTPASEPTVTKVDADIIRQQDQKIDALSSQVSSIAASVSNMANAVNQLGQNMARQSSTQPSQPPNRPGQRPQPVPVQRRENAAQTAPNIQADPRRRVTKPVNLRLPKTDIWKALNLITIAGLVIVLLFVVFNQNKPDGEAAQMEAAYKRAVSSTRIVSGSMATQLEKLADEIKDQQMKKEAFNKRLQEITKGVMLEGAEAPLKSLDEMDPWDPDLVAKRVKSSAQGYRDIEATIKKLE